MPEYCQRCNIEHDSQELGCWRLTCLDSKTPAPSFICHFFEPGKATYVMLCFYKKAVVKIHCDYTNTTAGLALGHMETSWGIWSSRKPTDTHYRPHVRDEETEVQRGLKSLAQVMGSGWNRIIWLHSPVHSACFWTAECGFMCIITYFEWRVIMEEEVSLGKICYIEWL